MQRKIDAELSRRSSKEVTERLNAQMDDYIKVSNTKRYGVYRDIIIPEEYDPLTPHEAIIHYANPTKYDPCNSAQSGAIRRNSAQLFSRRIHHLRYDPCKLELRMHAPPPGDDSEIGAAFAKPAEGHRLTPLMWDKLDCTPYGRFSKMMDKKVSDASAKTLRSSVRLDHYAYLTGAEGKSALDAEFPPGKRTYPNYQPGQMKVGEM